MIALSRRPRARLLEKVEQINKALGGRDERQPRSEDEEGSHGTWEPVRVDGRPTARVWCLGCGRAATLDDHEIQEDGRVSPSLICPHGCGWHESVRLDGWPGRSESE